MRGYVFKKGANWYAKYDAPRKADGSRNQQGLGTGFPTRKAAQDALTDALAKIGAGTYVEPSRQTVAEYLTGWLDGLRVMVRPSTLESYALNVRVHVLPAIGGIPLQGLTAERLNGLYADLLAGRDRRPLSARTVRYIHTIIRKALGDAVRKGRLTRNVAALADPPTPRATKAPEMQTWSAEELRAFLEFVHEDRLYTAWAVIANTGMRRGELLGLRWEDVDLDSGRIAVRRSLNRLGRDAVIGRTKTGVERAIKLDGTTLGALKEHRRHQAEERLACGPAYQDSGLVFAQEEGSAIYPERLTKWFQSHVRRSGLRKIRLHDLRHTHATIWLRAGVHPKVASERLGHSSIAITMDTYSHAIPAMQEEAAERVAALVYGS